MHRPPAGSVTLLLALLTACRSPPATCAAGPSAWVGGAPSPWGTVAGLGDGYDDVAATAYCQHVAPDDAVLVFPGGPTGLGTPWTLLDDAWSYQAPQRLLGLGDLDGDGHGDFAVAAPFTEAQGTVHVYRGSAAGPRLDQALTGDGRGVVGLDLVALRLDPDPYLDLVAATSGGAAVWSGRTDGFEEAPRLVELGWHPRGPRPAGGAARGRLPERRGRAGRACAPVGARGRSATRDAPRNRPTFRRGRILRGSRRALRPPPSAADTPAVERSSQFQGSGCAVRRAWQSVAVFAASPA